MLLTDGYKLDHRRQYPEGTEFIYANWTARSDKYFPIPENKQLDGYVVFGVQYLCVKYLIEEFKKNFFDRSEVMDMFEDSKYSFRRRGAYPLLTDIFGCGFTDKGYYRRRRNVPWDMRKLKELNPSELALVVTHAIQEEGLRKVSKVYDKVFITNSYKDWQDDDAWIGDKPENVIVSEYQTE